MNFFNVILENEYGGIYSFKNPVPVWLDFNHTKLIGHAILKLEGGTLKADISTDTDIRGLFPSLSYTDKRDVYGYVIICEVHAVGISPTPPISTHIKPL